MLLNKLHPDIKKLVFIGCTIIFFSQIFQTIERVDNIVIYNFPDKELLLLGLIFIAIAAYCRPSFYSEKTVLLFSLYFFYSLIITIINYSSLPDLTGKFATRSKPVFIGGLLIIYFFLLCYAYYLSKANNDDLKTIIKIFFNLTFLQSLIGLILWFAYIIKANPFAIGVNIGYTIPRAQGFAEEPSMFGPIALLSSIYFIKVSKFKFLISIIAAIVSFSSTFILVSIIIIFLILLYKVIKLKNWLLKINILILTPLILFIVINSFYQTQIFIILVQRIADHISLIIDFIKEGNIIKSSIHAPRVFGMINGITILLQSNWFCGMGLGSQVYLLNSWEGSIPFYLISLILETGIVGLFLHFLLLKLFFKKMYSLNKWYLLITLVPFFVWLINGGASYFLFYFLAFLLYFNLEKNVNQKA